MEGYSLLILLLSCVGCMSQADSVVLSAAMTTVTEGTQTTIDITCTLDVADANDLVFVLKYGTTSTSENTYDHEDIDVVTCTVFAGSLTGMVSIALHDDVVVDIPGAPTGEMLVIEFNDDHGFTTATGVTITIVDDGIDATALKVVPRSLTYKTYELMTDLNGLSTATVTLDFYDANGDIAPAEEALTIAVTYPTQGTTDSASAADYTDTTTAPIVASTGAAPVLSSTFTIVIDDDTDVENLETFEVMMADMAAAAGASITATDAPMFQVQIRDNEKREFIVIHDSTPIPRRSKKDATIWAIVDEATATDTITYTNLPHNAKDIARKTETKNSYEALKYTLARPRRNTKSRFNEYTFLHEQTFGPTVMHQRTVHTFLTPTSHTEKEAPIEAESVSTLTVYPDAMVCTTLDKKYTISVPCDPKTRRQLRWDFIPEGGLAPTDCIRLNKYKGSNSIPIENCDQNGLYIVFREGRGKIGWQEYIRVTQAVCPAGMYNMAGTCMTSTEGPCGNGGVLDQALNLCTCPPGFAGAVCEIALAAGTFGGNCQFNIGDYTSGKKGKCVTFSYPDTFGVTCAAGFGGKDCCTACKGGTTFGANCAQTCNCLDSLCDPYSGVCANGCKDGFSGTNCQTTVP